MNYERAKNALMLVLLSAFVALAVTTAIEAYLVGTALEAEICATGPRLERQIALQGDRTREMVSGVVGDVAARLDGQVTALRADLKAESAEYRKTADARLAAIQSDAREQLGNIVELADRHLGQANASISKVATIAEMKPTVDAILGDFAKTSKLMFDCEASPRTCVAPRFAGTFRAVELASGEFYKSMKLVPGFVATAQQTNGHIERYVNRFTQPKSKGAQVRDIGLTLAGFGWRVAMR